MIRKLDLGQGDFLLVEIEDGVGSSIEELMTGKLVDEPNDLPDGSRLTSAVSAEKAKELLFKQLKSASNLVHAAMSECSPNEFTLEMHIKFGGESTIIPFLAKASGEGGMKVVAKWNNLG